MSVVAVDLTMRVFGRLLVLYVNGRTNSNGLRWDCECDCGKIVNVSSGNLISGHTKSCGCLGRENVIRSRFKHGGKKLNKEEYISWCGMKKRCYNSNEKNYCYYGGRGIVVCDRWLNSFENFISDMGKKPSKKHSLDRIDTNGIYEPSNCRWATSNEQNINKRNFLIIKAFGKEMSLADWAKELNTSKNSIRHRVKRGTTFEEAIDYYKKRQLIVAK